MSLSKPASSCLKTASEPSLMLDQKAAPMLPRAHWDRTFAPQLPAASAGSGTGAERLNSSRLRSTPRASTPAAGLAGLAARTGLAGRAALTGGGAARGGTAARGGGPGLVTGGATTGRASTGAAGRAGLGWNIAGLSTGTPRTFVGSKPGGTPRVCARTWGGVDMAICSTPEGRWAAASRNLPRPKSTPPYTLCTREPNPRFSFTMAPSCMRICEWQRSFQSCGTSMQQSAPSPARLSQASSIQTSASIRNFARIVALASSRKW
mmetsp:Transcript_74784/g.206175  ORF Transcript_74784/g.206175 Transcript_74784/m.206175 type:complete len:264 (+) Transcript_74784:384-1175(+)